MSADRPIIDDRHAAYVAWVVRIAKNAGVPLGCTFAGGKVSDRCTVELSNGVVITVVVPPPPNDWMPE